MTCLRFNIYAMAEPTNRGEYIALLEEATRMADDLIEQSKALTAQLERLAKKRQNQGWDD